MDVNWNAGKVSYWALLAYFVLLSSPSHAGQQPTFYDPYIEPDLVEGPLGNGCPKRGSKEFSQIANKPTAKEFMDKSGADFYTATSVLSTGSRYDSRNWETIMASENPVATARAASGHMYSVNNPCSNSLGVIHTYPSSENGCSLDLISQKGNFQYVKQHCAGSNVDVYLIVAVDKDGRWITTQHNIARLGLDTSVLADIKEEAIAKGEKVDNWPALEGDRPGPMNKSLVLFGCSTDPKNIAAAEKAKEKGVSITFSGKCSGSNATASPPAAPANAAVAAPAKTVAPTASPVSASTKKTVAPASVAAPAKTVAPASVAAPAKTIAPAASPVSASAPKVRQNPRPQLR